jgi:hypothetical protein
MNVAGDPGSSTLARLGAMRVLASYGDRRVWISWEDLEARNAVVLPFTDHPLGRDGAVALPPNTRALVLARLQTLGRDDPDESVRRAGQFLVKAFPLP